MASQKMVFVKLYVCIVAVSAWCCELDAAADDLQLAWKVPKESQFLGFCGDNGNDDFTIYVIAPEVPKTIFSREKVEEKKLHSSPLRKKSGTLSGYNGYEVIYLSPECVFEKPPFCVESLLLPSESISGEISAILGGPFVQERVLKYEPSKGKAQIRRSSIEIRQPIRSYSGRVGPGQGLSLDDIKLRGKNTECRLSFCADVDLVLGTAMQQELSQAELGHLVKLDLLTNSNPIVHAPVAKQLAFVDSLDLDGLVIDKICCLLDDQCCGLHIGWGLLQDFDFEMEFHGTELEFRIYDAPTTRKKLLRKSELNCMMTDVGLRIVDLANWSTLFHYLQKGDLVLRAGEHEYPGEILRNAEMRLLSQRFNGGTIEVIRNGVRMNIDITKDESSFELRDRFLFNRESR